MPRARLRLGFPTGLVSLYLFGSCRLDFFFRSLSRKLGFPVGCIKLVGAGATARHGCLMSGALAWGEGLPWPPSRTGALGFLGGVGGFRRRESRSDGGDVGHCPPRDATAVACPLVREHAGRAPDYPVPRSHEAEKASHGSQGGEVEGRLGGCREGVTWCYRERGIACRRSSSVRYPATIGAILGRNRGGEVPAVWEEALFDGGRGRPSWDRPSEKNPDDRGEKQLRLTWHGGGLENLPRVDGRCGSEVLARFSPAFTRPLKTRSA